MESVNARSVWEQVCNESFERIMSHDREKSSNERINEIAFLATLTCFCAQREANATKLHWLLPLCHQIPLSASGHFHSISAEGESESVSVSSLVTDVAIFSHADCNKTIQRGG